MKSSTAQAENDRAPCNSSSANMHFPCVQIADQHAMNEKVIIIQQQSQSTVTHLL